MAQTTTRPPPRATAHPEPPENPPPVPLVPRMPMPTMPPMVTDRNLLDQLRQIYQTSQRHLPVPSSTNLNKQLEDTLEEIADMAEKAVKDYSG